MSRVMVVWVSVALVSLGFSVVLPGHTDDATILANTDIEDSGVPICPILWRVPVHDNMTFNADTGDIDGDGRDDVAIVPDDLNEGDRAIGQADNNTFQVIGSDGTELWSREVLLDKGIIGVGDIDLDGFAEIIVTGTTAENRKSGDVHAFNHDGNLLWKTELLAAIGWYPIYSISIIFTNADADENLELVLPPGGNPRGSNQPIRLIDDDGALLRSYWDHLSSYVILENLTRDEEQEVVLFMQLRNIDAFPVDLPGNIWGKTVDWYGLDWYNHIGAIGDIDGDSHNDVLSVARDGSGGEYANGLIVIRNSGQEYWRKEFARTMEDMPGMPLLRDLNHDGRLDVLVGAERRIFAFADDGTEMWTLGNESFFRESPDIFAFDIDKDGYSETIFQNDKVIYELSPDGTASGYCEFPQDSRFITRKAQGLNKGLLVSGDMDGDGFEELIIEERAPDRYHVAVLSAGATEVKVTLDIDPDTL
ncbi:MAG: hypothetical protein KAW09_09445, partial [Thermoplasmata archaeon]|nr:hypothetical protein [Thermoplasmata archaeon]